MSTFPPAPFTPPVTVDPSTGQDLINYGLPSLSQLNAENLFKLSSARQANVFSRASSTVNLVAANGNISATQVGTNSNLGVVQPVPTGGVSPNMTPAGTPNTTDSLKVTITQAPNMNDAAGNQIVFDTMPEISESRAANYRSFTPIQHPGEIMKYEGSSSREWTVTVRLISRTVPEAAENLRKINLIRSWTLPFYGQGTASDPQPTAGYLGAPPPVLTLQAYGPQMIGPAQVVLLNYQWNWPNDVDWINTGSPGVPFPVIITVSLSFRESWSPAEYSAFDIVQYRQGNLPAAFGGAPANLQSSVSGRTPNANAGAGQPASAIDQSQANSLSQAAATSSTFIASAAGQPSTTAGSALQGALDSAAGQFSNLI